MPSRTKYLVCVDKREESRKALYLACLRARARGGLVDLLHVLPTPDFQTFGSIAERMRAEQRAEAETLLKQLAEDAQNFSGITPSFVLREGDIHEEIVAAAMEDPEVSMLVLAVPQTSNSGGKLVSWLAGQLNGKLLVPLLLVPSNITPEQLEQLR